MDPQYEEETFEEANSQNVNIDPLLVAAFAPQKDEENLINVTPEDKSSSEYELSFEDVIEYLEHILRGHSMNSKTKEWDVSKEKDFALLNDRGIQDVKYACMAVCNRNVYLSNIDKERVYYFVRTLRKDVAVLLAFNYLEYGARKQYLDYILDIVTTVVASALFRSMDGGERKIRKENVIKRYLFGGRTEPQKQHNKQSGALGFLGL